MMYCRTAFSAAALLFGPGGMAYAADAIPDYIGPALKYPGRPPLEMEQDGKLKAADIVAFSSVKSGMNVIELMPDGGYYTRILSAIVGPQGNVYAVVPPGKDRTGPMIKDPSQNFPLTRIALAYTIEDQPEFKNVGVYWEPLGDSLAVPQQADLVFSAYDYHVLKSVEFSKLDLVKVNKATFNAMKSGGTYVIVDYAAAKGAPKSDADTLDRVDPDAIKAEMLQAGFVFDGESKVLADEMDDHEMVANDQIVIDDPKGGTSSYIVIPPDTFVLRFKKPQNAPNSDKRPAMSAMEGYFGNTRRGNYTASGTVTGSRERRVFYQKDGTYQEFGAKGSGNNPFQSGTWFVSADAGVCMHHKFPADQRDLTTCSDMSPLNVQPGKEYSTDDGRKTLIVPGYSYFDN